MCLVNLHTHHSSRHTPVIELLNVPYGQRPGEKATPVTAGLHPWFLPGTDLADAEQWLRQYAERAATLAIGETGLDKASDTPWALQLDAFELCVRVAAEFEKPLIVHCVKAYAEVLQVLNRQPRSGFRVVENTVFHGFDKNPQTARMLLDAGCYLSFGAALFREKSRAAETLRSVPANRFFLETDDKLLDLRAVYARAAEIRGVLADQVKAEIWQNFKSLFRYGYL